MYQEKTVLFLYAESSLHPGAGSGVSHIDLPVQRERFTNLPIIQASGLKGSVRDYFESQSYNVAEIQEVFGPKAGPAASEHAGALSMGEAKLLLFPVRSLYGVFAYITCPFVLQRFKRDLELVDSTAWPEGVSIVKPEVESLMVISPGDSDKTIIAQQTGKGEMSAVFDEFNFKAEPNEDVRGIAEFIKDFFPTAGEYKAWKEQFPSRFAVVPDNVFVDFTKLAAEVVTRNRIDDTTGTVTAEEGGLWTEEYLPSETMLYSIILATKPFKENPTLPDASAVIDFVKRLGNKRFQIGGNQTIGQGITMAHFLS